MGCSFVGAIIFLLQLLPRPLKQTNKYESLRAWKKHKFLTLDCKWGDDIKVEHITYRCARLNLTENSCIFFMHRIIEHDLWTEILKSTWIQTCFTLCLIYLLIGIPAIYFNKVNQSNTMSYSIHFLYFVCLIGQFF